MIQKRSKNVLLGKRLKIKCFDDRNGKNGVFEGVDRCK